MGVECPKCKTENTSDSEFCKEWATPLPSSAGVFVTKILKIPIKKLTKGTISTYRFEIHEELGKYSIVN